MKELLYECLNPTLARAAGGKTRKHAWEMSMEPRGTEIHLGGGYSCFDDMAVIPVSLHLSTKW